jgi:cell division protein FtsX
MGSNRNLWSVIATVALFVIIAWFSTSWGQGTNSYQTETHVYATPEYRTDTTRAIEAYEKVMQRYMDVTEKNFSSLAADMKAVTSQLNAMNAKLTAIDARLAQMEKHLGLAAPAAKDPNAPVVPAPSPRPQGVNTAAPITIK